MKTHLLGLALLVSFGSQAQKIALQKGQQITITTTMNQDVDMTAMGMQMKNATTSTGQVMIKDSNKDNFITTYKLSKLNLLVDVMGQETKYDSEKPEDKDTDVGKSMAEKIGKEVTVIVNKNTGKASLEAAPVNSPERQDDPNPMGGLMNAFGSVTEEANVETVFFLVPTGKKVGESWVDSSSSTDKMKDVRTYTLKSLQNGIADVNLASVMQGSSTTEVQGMAMEISMNMKTDGQILVDTNTSLVKKRSTTANLNGNIEMMGQSIPMTSKAVVTVEYK